MNVILQQLREWLWGKTEVGHALVGLFLWGVFVVFGQFALAVAVPVTYYLAREERDAEMQIKGSVWTKWPRAFAVALRTKDFLFPTITVLVASGLYLLVSSR